MQRKTNPDIKTYCYNKDCIGPVVQTGFNLLVIDVCKVCGEEISLRLKNEILDRIDGKDVEKEDDELLWGL